MVRGYIQGKSGISNFTIFQSRIWLTCSPFLLNGTISAHLKEFICKFIRDLYVDDSSSSFDDTEDAYSFYKRAKSILNLAQFDLCKWETNDIKLKKQIQTIESLDSSDNVPSTDDLQLTTRKVLGVNWDTKTDKFVFDFQEIATNALNLPTTKRNILKICNTFFDSLGVLSPIVLQTKLIFKELCINKYEWGTDIDYDIKMQWNEFLKDLVALRVVSVRRHVLCCTQRNV